MRQNRIVYYADFAVYPVLIGVMLLAIADRASSAERELALAFALGGAFLWALLEYLSHRFALRADTRMAGPHDQHPAGPRAWIGTPTWLSVAAIAFIALLPASLGVPLIVTLSLAAGLMMGFLWYGVILSAIRDGGPQLLAQVIK